MHGAEHVHDANFVENRCATFAPGIQAKIELAVFRVRIDVVSHIILVRQLNLLPLDRYQKVRNKAQFFLFNNK